MTVRFNCTAIQAQTLYDFASSTLNGGALRFEWQHPRTGATIECRIVPNDKELIKFTPDGPVCWVASFNLEVLP